MGDRRGARGSFGLEGVPGRRAVLRAARVLALLFGLGGGTVAGLACPQPGDALDAWIVGGATSDAAPALALRQRPPSVPGLAASIWNRRPVALLLVPAEGKMEAQPLSQRLADAGSPRSSEVSANVLATPDAACASLLLHVRRPGVPSALVHFDASGVVADVQLLTAQALGFDPARYDLSVAAGESGRDSDSADKGDEHSAPILVVSEGNAARGALIRRPAGDYALDPAASALVVWNSFLNAARQGDAPLAVGHLMHGSRNYRAKDLLAAGEGIASIAKDVVYVGVNAESVGDQFVEVQTVVRIRSDSHRLYASQILRDNGLWFIGSM